MSDFRVRGADGKTIEVPDSRWYMNAKGRTERMQRNSLSREARQVYACLELGTMGFSQEVALMRKGDRDVRMTFAFIAERTGLRRQHIHDRYWPELEQAGLVKKRAINPELPLQQGNIELISWAEPKAPETESVPARGYRFPEWAPPSWADPASTIGKFLKRNKIELAESVPARDEYIEKVETAAHEYEKAENSLRALLDLSRAPDAYKEERNERNIERNNSSSSSEVVVTTSEPEKAEEEQESAPLPAKTTTNPATFAEFQQLYPTKRFDGSKARPLFDALSIEQKQNCIERLQVYVQSPRWRQTPQYIPFASKWLQTAYDEAPPPLYDYAMEKAQSKRKAEIQDTAERIRRVAAMAEAMRNGK